MTELHLAKRDIEFMENWLLRAGHASGLPPISLPEYDLKLIDSAGGLTTKGFIVRTSVRVEFDQSQGLMLFDTDAPNAVFVRISYCVQSVPQTWDTLSYQDVIGHIRAVNLTNPKDRLPENAAAVLSIHGTIMRFLAWFKPDLHRYSQRVSVQPIQSGHKKHGKKKRPKIKTVIYLSRCLSELPAHKQRSKCEYSFTVRGHYRRYKSGKVVYIAPYTKNKDAAATLHRCYAFASGDDL